MTKSHSRDDYPVRFGSGSQEGGQMCRAWPEKSNDGYANKKPTDTASQWTTRDESEERKPAYAQTMCSFSRQHDPRPTPSALYAYSFSSAATELL
ncbi:hypothetical protein IFM47457_02053 [Aspergillus lentulus]|nr:hypothetical protein IFM47457_02053 [Aspergillus lentulus]